MESSKPKVKLVGVDGNVFNIIGIVSRALKQAGQADKVKEFQERATSASSYDEVLSMLHDYVDPFGRGDEDDGKKTVAGPFPAGKYYVGDLCYVMHDAWKEVCCLMFPTQFRGPGIDGIFSLKDSRDFAIFSTAHGDGCYASNQGAMVVDSGTIGCILVSDIKDPEGPENLHLGVVVDFPNEFSCWGDEGEISFDDGRVYVDTRDEEEEEIEEECCFNCGWELDRCECDEEE